MEEIKTVVLSTCTALIVGEIIYYITPKNKLSDCVYSLIYTLIIVSAVLALFKSDFNFNIEDSLINTEEMYEDIDEYYKVETQKEVEAIVEGALNTLAVQYKEIEVTVSANESTITLEKISVSLLYKADIENARTVINHAFANQVPLEVTGDK